MIHSIAGSMALFFYKKDLIKEDEIEVYEYGAELLCSTLLNVLGIAVLMCVLGTYFETLLYFAAFSPVRVTAGGYHAKTHLRCFLMSAGVYLLSMLLLNIPLPLPVPAAAGAAMTAAVIIFAPAEHRNRALTGDERAAFRRRAVVFAAAAAVLSCAAYIFSARAAACLFWGLVSAVLSMLAGVIENAVT
ncbi:MAG TPA: accessory gene regulator B family protein [Candidatus Monoglobus merdigallinarum]|uniref:Accessory gene regulator B family protein n=1 Tax=Candidatus Monoglobus merdigallinarum TaxID=2838698 RepID=A0A9D1TMW9_9FIRM|nr:accessory gene regulator B family protein [Candidatus Monoglobus merdigallinarum]